MDQASHQVSLTGGAACGRGRTFAGELVRAGAEVVAMAEYAAQHTGELLPRATNENARAAADGLF